MKSERLESIQEVRSYLSDGLLQSKEYPPETRFELGYYAALTEVARMVDPRGYDSRRSWWLSSHKKRTV